MRAAAAILELVRHLGTALVPHRARHRRWLCHCVFQFTGYRARSCRATRRYGTLSGMATFALVHGAWHGAWCWDLVVPLLCEAGHSVVAVDLPCEDPTATFEDYADVVCAALDGRGPVVAVGHSLAGQTIPLVAARRPVQRLIYLSALPPEPGYSFADQVRSSQGMLNPLCLKGFSGPDAHQRWKWDDRELARHILFGDCLDTVADAALERLRAQALHPFIRPCPLEARPNIPSTYIACADDQLVGRQWAMNFARDNLRADIVQMPGSHSPFLSRPTELAAVLLTVAAVI